MEKPKKPIEPNIKDFPRPKKSNGENHLGEPLFLKTDYYVAYDKYRKELKKYESELEVYEQIKLIRLVKNSTEKYCLKALKITKI